jgi:hypothetical protein
MKYVSVIISFFFLTCLVYAQDIQILTHGMTKYEPVGTEEIAIYFEVVNVSLIEQTIFEVRTLDDLPAGWSSSLCFTYCFASFVDSIATDSTFNMSPIAPGDTLYTSVHVFTDLINEASAHVQIQVGTFNNPTVRSTLDFTFTTDPSVSVNENNLFNTYYLFQNYPNPFNPSTKINYNVGEPGLVQLKIYNVLGVEVALLVNEQQNAGNYTIGFDAARLSSGVYFYSLSVNNFTQTRKMILEK